MKINIFKIALSLVVILSSCSKDDDTSSSKINGTWEVVSYETRQGNLEWEASSEICRLDDVEEYESNGDWTKYDGTNQCSAGTGITTGTWKLKANNTKIVYTYDDYSGEYESTVEQLTDNIMVISWSAGDLNNTQYRVTYSKN